jgi:hypothetical protein
MESATPLNMGLMESEVTLKSRRRSPVTDHTTIYDELIAPLDATMIRSICHRNAAWLRQPSGFEGASRA